MSGGLMQLIAYGAQDITFSNNYDYDYDYEEINEVQKSEKNIFIIIFNNRISILNVIKDMCYC